MDVNQTDERSRLNRPLERAKNSVERPVRFLPCLYVASAPAYAADNVFKFGCSARLRERLSTYLTGCPPGRTPSGRMEFCLVFETTARSKEELRDQEDELLDAFLPLRLMWRIPGDSEWFAFPRGADALGAVAKFVESQAWFRRRLRFADVRRAPLMARNYHKNMKILRDADERNEKLTAAQSGEIEKLRLFLSDASREAGYFVAPCGTGKTRMACQAGAAAGVNRLVVVCPTVAIELQWVAELRFWFAGVARFADCGSAAEIFAEEKFCLVVNRSSARKLCPLLVAEVSSAQIGPKNLQLLILDEAHHFAGECSASESEDLSGVGSTRAILLRAKELGIKRLSLTYTPRVVIGDKEIRVVSMSDGEYFGPKISEMRLKDLINAGILPDYRIWTLRDASSSSTGLAGKIDLLAEAWSATEMVGKEERYILNHLVVFTRDNQEAKAVKESEAMNPIAGHRREDQLLVDNLKGTKIIRVQGGQDLVAPLREFAAAKRAILLNCKVLGEGVDIPAADSVMITYHKESRLEITQMILRAGRWKEGKPLFHVLIPLVDDGDLSAFEEVLTSLASCDDRLREEIVRKSLAGYKSAEGKDAPSEISASPIALVVAETYAGTDSEDVRRCFRRARAHLLRSRDRAEIRSLCLQLKVDTSKEYENLRRDIEELPPPSALKIASWFDFLHPGKEKIAKDDFAKLIGTELRDSRDYDRWRAESRPELPTIQHISDGYFAGVADYADFWKNKGSRGRR